MTNLFRRVDVPEDIKDEFMVLQLWEQATEAQRAHDMRAFRRWIVDDVDTSEHGSPEWNAFCVEMADAFQDYMRDLGIEA